ncbi:MAG: TOBE domain-containing protein [Desulfovibrio sp.]|nr:TOBE domain-containing protein [Desulfovibrio sp.]
MTNVEKNHSKLSQFLHKLSASDRTWLLKKLLFDDADASLPDARRLHKQELLAAETWLWERAQTASNTRERLPRMRMWCIFLLLRYGALRVVEILHLRQKDLDFTQAMVRVSRGRTVPLPYVTARRMRGIWLDPAFAVNGTDTPLYCDPSAIRRCFQQCGRACGLPKGLLTARTLRRNRALELGRQGLPLPVVNVFLGRHLVQDKNDIMRFDRNKAEQLLQEHIHEERSMKTSARNVFQGRIENIRQEGILVHVVLRTSGGLRMTAIITDTSYKTLALNVGTLVNASIKAPWVILLPDSTPLNNVLPAENCYQGTVEQVRTDANVVEVLVTLQEGSQVCALCANGAAFPVDLAQGQTVTVYFKAFSVILTLD